jgi:hypothetical protein
VSLRVARCRESLRQVERGLIVKKPGGGRSTSYRLAGLDETPV